MEDLQAGRLPIVGSVVSVMMREEQLRHFVPLVEKVVVQTQERVFQGNRHVKGKVLSLFEPHSQALRKGKAHKPTEFGRLVRVDEVENGIVSCYEVLEGNAADTKAWGAALRQHQLSFGRPPRMATADRGYFSASNEKEAEDSGVERVALPARGRLSQARTKRQKQRWFQRALRWRAGIEARISTLTPSSIPFPWCERPTRERRDSALRRVVRHQSESRIHGSHLGATKGRCGWRWLSAGANSYARSNDWPRWRSSELSPRPIAPAVTPAVTAWGQDPSMVRTST